MTNTIIEIDFNDASEQWRKNKICLSNGTFKYKCLAKTKLGLQCKKPAVKHSNYCCIHNNKTKY